MALDTRYIPIIFPQGLFRDKDTGLPLRNGVIYFWVDEARTTPKPIFKISGTPPNYIYTELPNPLNLNAIGTFQDPNTNEDIAPYFFPYDSDATDANIQLYFYEVYSEGGKTSGIAQFTREGQPNLAEVSGPPEEQFQNYVPNGQFLSHNDLAADPSNTLIAGEIRAPITYVAQGGWSFDRPSNSAARDIVTFDRLPGTFDNPRWAIRINTQTPAPGDAFKDLRLEFRDVNKFASTTQEYTFAFSGIDNDSLGTEVELILIKNFGTGGDTTTETPLTNFNITSAYPAQPYQHSFSFGLNTTKTIGPLNDDFIQLAIRFPVDAGFDVSLTDFSLAQGAITITGFPPQTDADTLTRGVAGWMPIPNPDGSDLYLPLQLTQQGLRFDSSEIGDAVAESQLSVYVDSLHPTTNRMLPDGNQYETVGYSPIGVPFSRLQSKYWNSTLSVPIYGTGPSFSLAYVPTATNQILLANNTEGVVAATADGTAPTGFTFKTVHVGAASYLTSAFVCNTNLLLLENNNAGIVTPVSAGTSGFTVNQLQEGSDAVDGEKPERTFIIAVAASALAGATGKFFKFTSTDGSTDSTFYVWYHITAEADPAPGGAPIKIELQAGDSAAIVCEKTREALNAWNSTLIITAAASTLTGGDFWTFSSTNGTDSFDYYVWYKVDGVGTDPAPANKIGIEIDVLSTDTDAQVATKTQIQINMKYFASPKWPGLFLRNLDVNLVNDRGNRYSLIPGIFEGMQGTNEYDTFQSHFHQFTAAEGISVESTPGGGNAVTNTAQASPNTEYAGVEETRPVNAAVNYVIKY